MRKIHPAAFIPGTLFWAALAVGLATDNPTIIGIGVCIALVFVAMVIMMKLRSSAAMRAERQRVWRDGIASRARVVNIGTNGGGLNDHPLVDFELDVVASAPVAAGGEPAYRVKISALVNKLAIPRVQPGCEIAVRLDPRDKSKLVIDEALTPYGY